MSDGVRYIKIARIDANGIDQTNTLQSLEKLIIPYSTEDIEYEILSITEKPTFFLYYVKPANVVWEDKADIKYSFSSSYSGAPSLPFLGTPQLTSSLDNQGFFLEGGLDNGGLGSNSVPLDSYRIRTYTQKDLNIRISSSVDFTVTGKATGTTDVTASIRICSAPLNIGGTPGIGPLLSSPPTVLTSSVLTQSIQDVGNFPDRLIFSGSYDLSFSIPAGSVTPGNCIYFQIFPQVDNGLPFEGCSLSAPINFLNGFFNISSSAAVNTPVGIIAEPYFGSNDFKRALDCQPLLNNAERVRKHNLYMDVDYSAGSTEPVNFDLIIDRNATKADVQFSNYTTRRHVIPRYEGSKSTSQKLNMFTRGDTGTFGKLPTIESLDANIYEFEWGGGTTPEIYGWGSFKLGDILQVSSKDAVKKINSSEGEGTILVNSKSPQSYTTTRNYRIVVADDNTTLIFPPQSVLTSSINSNYFWVTPQKVSDYYYILNTNNPINHEVALNLYPNPTIAANPVIPNTVKMLTTDFGIPSKSTFALTSSLSASNVPGVNNYGFIKENNANIYLYRQQFMSVVTTDDNGFYQSGVYNRTPQWQSFANQVNKDLNNGERWFVTLYNEFEFPNNQGDYNQAISSSLELKPYNTGYSASDANGNYVDPLSYKGVYEIIGVQDAALLSTDPYVYILTNREFKENKNIGGNGEPNTPLSPQAGVGQITGPSLGMLIWKAKDVGKNQFIIVQDEITGGVGAGAFISKNTTQEIKDNFDEITKTYGANTN